MTRKLCRVCAFPTDSARDITHYRTCVKRKDWPEWVRRGGSPTVTVDATPLLDGSEPPPFPPLEPVRELDTEPAKVEVLAGAVLAFSKDEETGEPIVGLLCDCGYLAKDHRALVAHRRAARVHREAVPA